MTDHAELFDEIYERALAERAVSCAGWLWGGGMLVSIPPEKGESKRSTRRLMDGESIDPSNGMLPVFRDACTRGCLRALVQRSYRSVVLIGFYADTTSGIGQWGVNTGRGKPSYYATETEALVAALEDAQIPKTDQGDDDEQDGV